MTENKITIKMVADDGTEELIQTPEEAYNTLKTHLQDDEKWLYINGDNISDINSIDAEKLNPDDYIILRDRLGGG